MVKKIRNMLECVLPNGWERVDFFSTYDKTGYEIFFFVTLNGKKYQCLKLYDDFNITEDAVHNTFQMIYNTVLKDLDNMGMYFSFTSSNDESEIHNITDPNFGIFDWLQIYK